MSTQARDPHVHGEAFKLMTYRSEDGTEEEIIWNSRDGVTPFLITLRSGKTARHVDWHLDQYRPDFTPQPGTRMFIDLTPERMAEIQAERAKTMWNAQDDYGLMARERWASPDAMAADLARDLKPGEPDLVVVEKADWSKCPLCGKPAHSYVCGAEG